MIGVSAAGKRWTIICEKQGIPNNKACKWFRLFFTKMNLVHMYAVNNMELIEAE